MKTFKELKTSLDNVMEYSTLSQTAAWQTVNGTGSHNVENEKALGEVNMFIARNLNRLFTDPATAINMLRTKLNFVGIDFKPSVQEMSTEGELDFPVTRHGGSFGTKPDHDLSKGFYTDNGLMGMQMSLKGSCTMESTGYRIELKLVPTQDQGLDSEDPDPASR